MEFPRLQEGEAIKEDLVRIKSQRDPKSYEGLERMLLSWINVLSFLVTAGIAMVSWRETPFTRAVQGVSVALALGGTAYSVWRYLGRQQGLQKLYKRKGNVMVDQYGYVYLVLVLVAAVGTSLALAWWHSYI